MEVNVLSTLVAIGNTLDTITISGRKNIASMNGCIGALERVIQKIAQDEQSSQKKDKEDADTNVTA